MFHNLSTVSKRVRMERSSRTGSYPVTACEAIPPFSRRGPGRSSECAFPAPQLFPRARDYKSRQLDGSRLVPGETLRWRQTTAEVERFFCRRGDASSLTGFKDGR